YRQENAGTSHDDGVTEARLSAVGDGRDVGETHWYTADCRHDRLGQVVGSPHLPAALDENPLIRCVDEAAATNAGPLLDGTDAVVEAQVPRHQVARPDLDLDLPHRATENVDPRDAGYGEQARPQRPLPEVAQLHRRQSIAHESDLEEIHG